MSAALDTAVTTPADAPPVVTPSSLRTPRPRTGVLRLVPKARSKAARAPFAVVVVALLVGGLLGLLALNTALAQDAFALHALKVEGRELAVREQALQRDVEGLRTPEALAARAQEMGMVPAGPPAFLRLSDGAVIGAPEPGVAPIEPSLPDTAAFTDPDAEAPVDGSEAATEDGGADPDGGSTTLRETGTDSEDDR